ncbi:MAG: hypothetical protein CR997_07150 [Acidobacteria bacterium]|nr:MAG: hypothetical protein CR997_07150 [Acidobacteriota bacterium]
MLSALFLILTVSLSSDSLRVVSFEGVIGKDQKAWLEQVSVHQLYLGNSRYLVKLKDHTTISHNKAGIKVQLFDSQNKMSSNLQNALSRLKATKSTDLWLMAFPEVKIAVPKKKARTMGFISGSSFTWTKIRLLKDHVNTVIPQLLSNPDVLWIDLASPMRLLNDQSVWVCQSGLDGNQLTTLFEHGLNGEGVTVGFLDTGVDADSCYFYDQNTGLPNETLNLNQRKIVSYQDFGSEGNWDSQGHGTHVGGSIAGDQAPYGIHDSADGMAPSARLVVQDGGYAIDDFADMPFLPTDYYNDIFQRAYDDGARIHSNSWGAHENYGTNNYTVECQMTDQFMWDNRDFLVFFAAGNSGHSGAPTISDPATAKNVMAVAATMPGSQAGSLAGFSSNGPVIDGRLKPDIAAPGYDIISARNDFNINSFNCNTRSSSGTSMACPTAAGMAALAMQYYQDGFYPSGVATPADALVPSAALLKATVIMSGRPMSGESSFPNNNQGWGRITMDDALYFDGDPETIEMVDNQTGLLTGQDSLHSIQIAEGQTLKAVLVWTDYPSNPMANTNLVNDLDLEITGPDGTYLGNVFGDNASALGGDPDRINNVEAVWIKNAQGGSYQLKVKGFNIPEGPQPFALIWRLTRDPQEEVLLHETGISQQTNQDLFYSVEVPADALSLAVETLCENGDADIYVKFGSVPTTSDYDASSASSNSHELIKIPNPQEGTWHILLHAYTGFTDLELKVTILIPHQGCQTLDELLNLWPEQGVDIRTLINALSCIE